MDKKAEYVIHYPSEVVMSKTKEIEKDVSDFLSNLENLKQEEKKEALLMFMKKHTNIEEKEIVVSYDDLQSAIESAKSLYVQIPFPVRLQDNRGYTKELASNEIGNYCMAESMISLLNKKGALKGIPSFKKGR